MRRTMSGWFLTVTGFLACPCHLVITLPLAVALLSGTALGGWIATHEGAIAAGAALYFVGALVVGFTLLHRRRVSQAGEASALPTGLSAGDVRRPVGIPRTSRAGGRPSAGGSLDCCQPDQRLTGLRHDVSSRSTRGTTPAGQATTSPERAERAVGSGAATGRDA